MQVHHPINIKIYVFWPNFLFSENSTENTYSRVLVCPPPPNSVTDMHAQLKWFSDHNKRILISTSFKLCKLTPLLWILQLLSCFSLVTLSDGREKDEVFWEISTLRYSLSAENSYRFFMLRFYLKFS